MVEIEKGVLIIGFSNTLLFGGEHTSELLLMDIGSGKDFSLPLTPEQTEYLFNTVAIEDMLNVSGEPAQNDVPEAPEENAENRTRLDGIIKGEDVDAKKHQEAWTESEAASQF